MISWMLKKNKQKKNKTEDERKMGEKKENSTELQKPNVEAEVYNNSKKRDWEKRKPQKLN